MPVMPFKRKLGPKRNSNGPIIPPPETTVRGGPLWDKPAPGKPITAPNVLEDVKEAAYDLRDEPGEFPFRLKQRLRDYQDRGPDINKPVPLTPNPFRRQRK